ncbi:SDR family NAD(P)-dependent oxidoreductase [Amycolatopsis rhabdoformis]|uniref:SDR family NAD(P)-dependent oxidoreductase n=1 Tax=Amycolatopsis rhabdoformis TaxID=1448059 RepID=A0ABZ1HWN5_9PSEU|nr:SDR family NAD(P)-dependent oxidoreductase [Amycolatopsis rhabdoformis]WSE26594.1 SDR family NAD(P)-dependent oxidoreductase [Amycolatopsis rhabdoformis]
MAGMVVVGAGPGIGAAVARRFAREGFRVALVARRRHDPGIDAVTHLADVADEHELRAALDAVVAEQGLPEVVVYNAAAIRRDEPGELGAQEHLGLWRVNVLGAYVTAAHLAPRLAERGHGTFLATGGLPAPQAAFTSLSLGKAGLRAVVELFAEQYPMLNFATVRVDGAVEKGTAFDPDVIAEQYWRLHTRRR